MSSSHFRHRAIEIVLRLLVGWVGNKKPRGYSRTWSHDAYQRKCRLEIYSGVSSDRIEGLAKRKKDRSCSEVRSCKGLPYLYFAEPAVLPVMKQYSTRSVLNHTCEAGESRPHRWESTIYRGNRI